MLNCANPVNKVLLGLRSDNLEVVLSAELPHHGQGKLLVTITDIFGTNTNKRKLHLSASIDGDLTINALLKDIIWLLLNAIPLDDLVVDAVDDL